MDLAFSGKRSYTYQDKPETKTERAPRTTIIKGGFLIDGNGGPPTKAPVVVLEGGRIKSVGSDGTTQVPANVEVIDCSGYTLMPGLMDLHIHTQMFNCLTFHNYRVAMWEVTPQLQQMYSLFHAQMCMDMGFTTLRDLGMSSSRGLLTEEQWSSKMEAFERLGSGIGGLI